MKVINKLRGSCVSLCFPILSNSFLAIALAVGGCFVQAEESELPKRSADEETKIERAKQLLNEMVRQEQILRKEREFMAQHFFENGRKHFDAKLFKEAIQAFRKALELDPKHEDAGKMLQEARRLAGIDSGRDAQSVLERLIAEKEVSRQMTKDELERALADGRDLYNQKRYQEAADSFDKALSLARWIPEMEGVDAFIQEARESLERCRKELRAEEVLRADRATKAAREVLSDEQRRQRNLVETRKKMLLERARSAMDSENFTLAMNLVDELYAVDPLNAEIKALKSQIERSQADKRNQEEMKKVKGGSDELMTHVTMESTPMSKLSEYPSNWGDLVQKRPTSMAAPEEVAEWKKNILSQMEKRVSFDFVDTPLPDVVAFLQNLTGVNMVIDPQAGAGGDVAVTLKVNDMRLAAAMDWILRLVSLKYILRDEAIYVSSSDRLEDKGIMRIYDVRDLLAQIPDFAGTGLPTISEGGGGGGGGGGDLFGGGEGGENEGISGDDLVTFIRENVAPSSWDEGGGL